MRQSDRRYSSIPTHGKHAMAVFAITAIGSLALAGGTPSNDDCENKLPLELGDNPFTTEGATMTGPGMCGQPIGKDVWFKFNSTFKGFLEVSTCGDANFDTVIGVYNSCGCTGTNLLACNDEHFDCNDHTSKLSLQVDAGKCYRVRVAGYQGDSGLGVLNLRVLSSENAAIADRILTGAAAGDQFGKSIAGNARFNIDDFRDVLIGAPRNDVNGADIGRGYSYTGSAFDSLYQLTGSHAGDQVGFSVAVADVNDDGRDDLIIGAPYDDTTAPDAGRVYAYSGFDGSLLWDIEGQAEGDRFGFSVAFGGDVNGDGFDDVLVGAPYLDVSVTKVDAGRAYVLNGTNGSTIFTRNGAAAGDLCGWAVAGVGDLDNDGKDDYIVGAPRNDINGADSGRVYISSGDDNSILKRFDGDAAGDRFGQAIASREFSFNGSVFVLVAVGAPYNDGSFSNAGRVRVYQRNTSNPGQNSCSSVLCHKWTINGANKGDLFGSSVAIGDLVANAFADVIVGAPRNDLNGTSSGSVYVLSGTNGALYKRFFGEAPEDQFGTSVAVAGDINDDGEADLIVGAPLNDAGGDSAGRAYAFFFNTVATLIANQTALDEEVAGELELTLKDDAGDTSISKPADLNADGLVDASDLATAIQSWGPCASTMPCSADLNGDDVVNVDDLLEVIAELE